MDDENQLTLFNTCIDNLASVIDVVNKYSDEKDMQTKYLKEIITKNYCLIDLEYERVTNAINNVREYLNQEDNPPADVGELFKSYLQKEKKADYLTHSVWYRIAKNERSVLKAMDVTENVSDHNEEYETIDDSLLCAKQNSQLSVDPITKSAVRRPCKNKRCGHLYDFDSIKLHIKRKKRAAATCPYLGCTETVKMDDLLMLTEDK